MKHLLFFFVFIYTVNIVSAQENEVSGTIVAFNKYPLKNVKVTSKKSKKEAITGEDGKFTIAVKKNDMLVIKAEAFELYRHKVNDPSQSIKINLIFEDRKDNKEVAIKEGYIEREDLEYGIEHLASENSIYSNFTDVFEAIKYAIPSATIISDRGTQKVQLRGTKSLTEVVSALFIVNGVPTEDITFIFPSEIVSIKQLSSAQAAIYGSRAGGGVIVINTK